MLTLILEIIFKVKICLTYITIFIFTGMYYGVSICLVSFASGLSVVTLNVYHRGVRGTKVPPLIKTLILGKLARMVFLQFERRDKHSVVGKFLHDLTLPSICSKHILSYWFKIT